MLASVRLFLVVVAVVADRDAPKLLADADNEPAWLFFPNVSNIWGKVPKSMWPSPGPLPPPGTVEEGFIYLGKFANYTACASTAATHANVKQFTYHEPKVAHKVYATLCYGQMGSSWDPHAEGFVVTGWKTQE